MNKNILFILKNPYFILFFVFFISPWSWKMLRENVIIYLLVFLISLILVALVIEKKRNMWLFILITIVFVSISFLQLKNHFNKEIFTINPTERIVFNTRHLYLANELREAYLNKFGIYTYTNLYFPSQKYLKSLFYNLDLGLYFFSNHPRERAGVDEFKKYHPVFLPFFLIGLLSVITGGFKKVGWFYFTPAVLISAFVTPNYSLGPVLLAPVIILMISIGIIKSLSYKK